MDMIKFKRKVWSHYLENECDFIDLIKMIEFESDNYGTYSPTIKDLILSTGSQIEIACKELCNIVSPQSSPSNIDQYRNILKDFKNFSIQGVIFSKDSLTYTPWIEWKNDINPQWWKDYNKVKHNGINEEKRGNIKNAFDSLAALFMLNRFLCRELSNGSRLNEPVDRSELFEMDGWPIVRPYGAGMVQVEGKINGVNGVATYKI